MLEADIEEDKVLMKLSKPYLEAGCKVMPIVDASCGVGRMANIIEVGRPRINVTEMGEKLNLKGIPVVVLPAIEFKTSTISCDENDKDGKISEYINKDNTIKEEIMDFEYHVLGDYENLSVGDSGCDLDSTFIKEEVDIDEGYICTKNRKSHLSNMSGYFDTLSSRNLTEVCDDNKEKFISIEKNKNFDFVNGGSPSHLESLSPLNTDNCAYESIVTSLYPKLILKKLNIFQDYNFSDKSRNEIDSLPVEVLGKRKRTKANYIVDLGDFEDNDIDADSIDSSSSSRDENSDSGTNYEAFSDIDSDSKDSSSSSGDENSDSGIISEANNWDPKFSCATCGKKFSSPYYLRHHSVTPSHIRKANQKKNEHTVKNWSSNPLNASTVPLVNSDPDVSMSVSSNETELLSNLPIDSTVPSVNADPEVCISVVNEKTELVPISPNDLTVPSVNADPAKSISDVNKELEIIPNLPNSSTVLLSNAYPEASISDVNKKIELLPNSPYVLTIPSVNTDPDVCISDVNGNTELVPISPNALTVPSVNPDPAKSISDVNKELEIIPNLPNSSTELLSNAYSEASISVVKKKIELLPNTPNSLTIPSVNTDPEVCISLGYKEIELLPNPSNELSLGNLIKKFSCATCGKGFSSRYHLRRHSLTHIRNANQNKNEHSIKNWSSIPLNVSTVSLGNADPEESMSVLNNKTELLSNLPTIASTVPSEKINTKCLKMNEAKLEDDKSKETGLRSVRKINSFVKSYVRPHLLCSLCDFSCKMKSNIRKHIFSCHIKGRDNNEPSNRVSKFPKRVANKFASKPYKCNLCNYASSRLKALSHHCALSHKHKHYSCSRCDFTCSLRRKFAKHVSLSHKFCCSMCNFTCDVRDALVAHILAVHKLNALNLKCSQCEFSCNGENELIQHILSLHEKMSYFKCSLCDFTCNLAYKLKEHKSSVHRKKMLNCPYCDFFGLEKKIINDHILGKHEKYDRRKYNSCFKCSFTCKNEFELNKHLSIEHGYSRRPHKCTKCDFVADTSDLLRRHRMSVHRKVCSLKCSRCNYVSSTKPKLANHIMSVHEKIKRFKCSLCNFSAFSKAPLNIHILAVHKKAKNVKCPDCDYKTSNKSCLDVHVNAIHKKLKPNKCMQCDYATTRPQYLRLHIVSVHDKTKNFKCPHCDHTSSRNDNLKAHIARTHKMNQDFVPVKKVLTPQSNHSDRLEMGGKNE